MVPITPKREILTSNQTALTNKMIPPIFEFRVTYIEPTIPTIEARIALIPNNTTSLEAKLPNKTANTPPSRPNIPPIIPSTSSIVLDVSFTLSVKLSLRKY